MLICANEWRFWTLFLNVNFSHPSDLTTDTVWELLNVTVWLRLIGGQNRSKYSSVFVKTRKLTQHNFVVESWPKRRDWPASSIRVHLHFIGSFVRICQNCWHCIAKNRKKWIIFSFLVSRIHSHVRRLGEIYESIKSQLVLFVFETLRYL